MKSLRLLSAVLFLSAFATAQTGALAPVPIQQPLSNPGLILPGGCLYTYSAGTTTPATTYSDSTLMTPNANPIVLNAFGRAPAIYMTNSLKMVLANKSLGACPGSPGTVIWSQDNVYDTGLALRAALAAASGASLIGFQQVNGTATTVQAALRNCPFDVQYATLSIAIANIPAYGCLNVIGTWTLTSGITISASNVSLYFQPTSVVQTTTAAAKLFTISGSKVSLIGSKGSVLDGHTVSGNLASVNTGVTGTTIKGLTFQNSGADGINVGFDSGGPYGYGASDNDFEGNKFKTITGTGIRANITGIGHKINGNSCDGITDDCIHVFGFGSTTPTFGLQICGNTATNLSRMGIEVQGTFYGDGPEVCGNSISGMLSPSFAISVGVANANVHNNQITGNATQLAGGWGIEAVGAGMKVVQNRISLFKIPINVGAANVLIDGNTINTGGVAGIGTNDGSQSPGIRIVNNVFNDTRSSAIAVGSTAGADTDGFATSSGLSGAPHAISTVDNNTINFTPVAGDASTTYVPIVVSGTDPVNISHNHLNILSTATPTGETYATQFPPGTPVVSGATIPAGFVYEGIGCFSAACQGSTFDANVMQNYTTGNFGVMYYEGAVGYFSTASIINSRFYNIANLGTTSDSVFYFNNQKITGSASPTIASTLDTTPVTYAAPTCAAGASAGVGATCTVSSTSVHRFIDNTLQTSFNVTLTTGTGPSTGTQATVTLATGEFAATPVCTFSFVGGDVGLPAGVGFNPLSATSVAITSQTSALTASKIYVIAATCR